jgi:hypothetical protein
MPSTIVNSEQVPFTFTRFASRKPHGSLRVALLQWNIACRSASWCNGDAVARALLARRVDFMFGDFLSRMAESEGFCEERLSRYWVDEGVFEEMKG